MKLQLGRRPFIHTSPFAVHLISLIDYGVLIIWFLEYDEKSLRLEIRDFNILENLLIYFLNLKMRNIRLQGSFLWYNIIINLF